ncbi:MAG: hypothetical protein A2Y62_03870 [Candidatus Fischerbacteria bacterium RBG_13_37_8]|uniref:Uncharacterized protein n=1 Tax=Candidatus Fischerbacteria bacterium RBG_13_37_8 TaxID=1817863 RepID=A0A1F5V5G9_9BACT|nr:MAG: hypothetical protein A2Y62_03870 [Candidatus Fischerbacteria bacterium RBG_13_37_8]
MKLNGDKSGMEELKYIKENKLFYLKFILKEAQTNTDHRASFRGRNMGKFILEYNVQKDEFTILRDSSE